MAHAPRPLATAVFVCRFLGLILQLVAMILQVMSEELGLSTFIFLKLVLVVELIFHSSRLLYDATQLFLHQSLPANRRIMTALVAAEWVMLHVLFAAGSASLAGTLDFVENNMRRCPLLPPGTCSRYRASGILTLMAWAFSVPIALMMIRLHAIWDHEAAAAL